jgi:hypothetical protein
MDSNRDNFTFFYLAMCSADFEVEPIKSILSSSTFGTTGFLDFVQLLNSVNTMHMI